MGQTKTPILLKSSLKLISYKCSSFLLTACLLCLVDVFFNRHSYGYQMYPLKARRSVRDRPHAKASQEK